MRPANIDLPADEVVRELVRGYLDAAATARAQIANGRHPEALHDLRVALRRLRASLRAYAPYVADTIPDKVRKRARDLARVTNVARDAEVQLAWVDSLGRKVGVVGRPGRRWLRAHLAAQRKNAYHTIRSKALPEFDRFFRILRRALESGEVAPSKKHVRRRIRFAQAAGRSLRENTARLSADLGRIGSVDDEAEVHAARIAAKRLHYLVEPLVTGKEAATVLKPLKTLQDRLGALHDRHVLARNLDRALRSGAPGDVLPSLCMLALRNRLEADGLYKDIARSYLAGRAPALLRTLRDFARKLAARSAHSASRA